MGYSTGIEWAHEFTNSSIKGLFWIREDLIEMIDQRLREGSSIQTLSCKFQDDLGYLILSPDSDDRDFSCCELGFLLGYCGDWIGLEIAFQLVTMDGWRADRDIFFALSQVFALEQRQTDLYRLIGLARDRSTRRVLITEAWDIYVQQSVDDLALEVLGWMD
jgi:hypothetical protein